MLRTSPDNLEALLLSADIAFAEQRADDALAPSTGRRRWRRTIRACCCRARGTASTGSDRRGGEGRQSRAGTVAEGRDGKLHEGVDQLLRGDAEAARATFQPIEGALADYTPALLLAV